MNNNKLIQTLGFLPKENTSGIFQKKYPKANNYSVEVDFENKIINFGNKVKGESKTTQNFSQTENWIVLECVDRLLEKGYQPQNITLEKTWKTGHGTSGRLDILVSKDDDSAYLMIECKNWGAEFVKEFKNLEKNGGQLFTYFQQDKNAEVLMLYTSKLEGKKIEYKNSIVKIEDDYRQTGNVKDFYERWNKLPKANGIFENWVEPYEFQSKALTRNDLKVLRQEDSNFIFNRFLEILRHNVVSDKPNAFNKIFTLFLCKIIDEDRSEDEQLHFQWLEGEDDHISFQKRLTDLYNRGMLELLEKKVTDVSDKEFDKQFQQVEDQYKDKFKEILTEIRLKKNNEFAIKEVYDETSFEDNAKVVKEVVELLQVYQIRYNYRQQFLSDFFEMLLTTGLKQESGQFFTPVPIARFIIKSLPIQEITLQKIQQGNKNDLLPTIIDYSAGSGHFITESMEVVQEYIDTLDENRFPTPTTKRAIKSWKGDQFGWAEHYVYAIEKDYRLVKTAKVSCYLHGDGLAKVIHGDGLGDFATSKDFKDLLKETDRTYPQDNKQFDIVISNPPYSVSAFKGTMMEEGKAQQAFELYNRLTDQSSEIECLFIERTKQLLKDGGVSGIILPSSILSNTGIYTQTREIILKYFEILGITELGSGTFMATGTNTVTLFLRRRNNADAFNIEEAVKRFFENLNDVTINGIENPVHKYVAHVWEGIGFDDYTTLLNKKPNDVVKKHEIFKEYNGKIKAKDDAGKWDAILALEKEKLVYFILAYPQKLVLVKTGEKMEEKRFLGYEFSNRRGSEGIHPIQRGKTIDECTHLFDADVFDNPEKASTYIYKAFQGEFDLDIPEKLQKNVNYQNLLDMLTFDRITFEKNISLNVKKKVIIESKWENTSLSEIATIDSGTNAPQGLQYYENGIFPFIRANNLNYIDTKNYIIPLKENFINDIAIESLGLKKFKRGTILFPKSGQSVNTNNIGILKEDAYVVNHLATVYIEDSTLSKYVLQYLKKIKISNLKNVESDYPSINLSNIATFKLPLPPLEIQQKIVSEIEFLEKKEEKAIEGIEVLKKEIRKLLTSNSSKYTKLRNLCRFSNKRVSSDLLNAENYVGVDNLLQNTKGKVVSSFVPISGTSTKYNIGDILLSNIRPYLKKIWFADNSGGSSNDVLVLQKTSENVVSKYIYYILRQDDFFDYEMLKPKGIKMPRGDKQHIMDYQIPLPRPSEQEKIVSGIEEIETKIQALENQIAEIPKQKAKILKKYL